MFKENVSLSGYSSYGIGGPARYFAEIADEEDLRPALAEIRQRQLPFFILGAGTNILFSDKGFDGVVLKISFNGLFRQPENENIVIAGAGVLMGDLLDFAVDKGLSGLEWAGGLPGTVGGAVRGNAGAFGGETKDSVFEVVSAEMATGEIRCRPAADCRFSYRSSIFKEDPDREIIIKAKFELVPGDPGTIRKAINEKIDYRKEKQPLEYPNVGSIFKNVDLRLVPAEHQKTVREKVKKDPFPVVPTAWLISECGLKGERRGGAMISAKHPNFIINFDKAKAADVKELIALAKEKVFEKFGIRLEEEVLMLE